VLTSRLATEDDLFELNELMQAAIVKLQSDFLSPAQIDASHEVMGLDSQLVADRTYFRVEMAGQAVGCGGWSRRATIYGGDHSHKLRDPALLDPQSDAARIRAMYTHPDFVRRGVGRLILRMCEEAAAEEGFYRTELMATLSGEPLYRACGYHEIERISFMTDGGVIVPLVRMGKGLGPGIAY
jgi:GNAT superfamily N-acetyltransferase